MIRRLGEVAMQPDKTRWLAQHTPDAVRECDCKRDIARMKSALWQIFDQERPVRWMFATLSADAAPLALPATMPWRDANARIAPGATVRPAVQ